MKQVRPGKVGEPSDSERGSIARGREFLLACTFTSFLVPCHGDSAVCEQQTVLEMEYKFVSPSLCTCWLNEDGGTSWDLHIPFHTAWDLGSGLQLALASCYGTPTPQQPKLHPNW